MLDLAKLDEERKAEWLGLLRGVGMITVQQEEDGRQVASCPPPARALFSAGILGLVPEVFEVIITAKFANYTARYKVVGTNPAGVLVADLLEYHQTGVTP